MIRLTRWQRLIASSAALSCLGRAWVLFDNDDPAGTAFVVGVLFTLVALIPPQDNEAWLPNPRHILRRYWRQGAIISISTIVIVAGAAWMQQRDARYAAIAEARTRAQNRAESEAYELARTKMIDAEYVACLGQVEISSTETVKQQGKHAGQIVQIYGKSRCANLREDRTQSDPISRAVELLKSETNHAPTLSPQSR